MHEISSFGPLSEGVSTNSTRGPALNMAVTIAKTVMFEYLSAHATQFLCKSQDISIIDKK